MDSFFTSDSHYAHRNIAGPTVSRWNDGFRDFDSVDLMNNALVSAYNVASYTDTIYHLGDWSFGDYNKAREFRDRINCRNIHLILGNHDEDLFYDDSRFSKLFNSVSFVKQIKINGQRFFLSHYSHRVWPKSHRGNIHLYGHSHGSLSDDPNSLSIDVGFETCLHGHKKYTMYHIDEILNIMSNKKKNWSAVDHHV